MKPSNLVFAALAASKPAIGAPGSGPRPKGPGSRLESIWPLWPRAAFCNLFSTRGQKTAITEFRATLQDIIAPPGDLGQDLDALVDDMVSGLDAILPEEAKQEAAQKVDTGQSCIAVVINDLPLGLAAACGGAFAAKPDDLIGDRHDDHA